MSDSGTDTLVGAVAVLFVVVAVVSAAQGQPLGTGSTPSGDQSASSARRSAAQTRPSTGSNIPGGPLLGCTGDMISDETTAGGGGRINLKVYYTAAAGGRNCAVATKVGRTSRQPGQIRISLRLTGTESTRWPQLAEQRTPTSAARTGAVYLEDTDGICVRADATFSPSSGAKPVTVSSGRTGCG